VSQILNEFGWGVIDLGYRGCPHSAARDGLRTASREVVEPRLQAPEEIAFMRAGGAAPDRDLVWVTAAFTVLTLILVYPLSVHPASTALPLGGDTRLFLWTIGWDVHALTHQPWALFDANIFAPERLTPLLGELSRECADRGAVSLDHPESRPRDERGCPDFVRAVRCGHLHARATARDLPRRQSRGGDHLRVRAAEVPATRAAAPRDRAVGAILSHQV
jgi:hypothetical protein